MSTHVAATPVATALADLACELGGASWLTVLACDPDPAAGLLRTVASHLCEKVVAQVGPDWAAEVEAHVDLFVAGLADDVIAATCSAGSGVSEVTAAVALEQAVAELATVAVSPQSIWLT